MALNLLPNNAMTFTENQHGTAVLEKLRSQRERVRCCDVILHVAGKQFQAHRCVLAACSPYFDSIFKASKTVKEQLTITSQDPEVFRCLLAYMYTGTVVVDKTNVAELLRLANKLLIAKLKEHCAEYLERYLDATNCLTVRDMATKFNLEALEKTTGTFIQAHLSDIIEGEEVLELSHTRLEDFLRSPIWQLHEDQTLLLVTRWVHHSPKSRERNLRSLLTWVQWSHLCPQTAILLIQTHPLYTTSSSLLALFFLLDALNEHSLLPADFHALFSKLKAKFCQPTDSVVDNESFLSLAISTAIDGLQDDQLGNGRGQEVLPVVSDLSSHTALPSHTTQGLPSDTEDDPTNPSPLQSHHKISEFHINSRRGCDDEDEEHRTQYDMCRIGRSSQDAHVNQQNLIFSHPATASNAVGCHSQISDDSVGDTSTVDDSKFTCDSQGHFGQPLMRNMAVWHQEPPYVAEESLSSDSSHMYQRQVYDQNFGMKVPCSDTYNSRVNPSGVYSLRESPHKNKQGFASAVSYYVSTYNPEVDMTVSDDQSTQSFPYDENFNSGINFYPCRPTDVKDTQHIIIESHHNQESYAKSYYHDESTNTQDLSCNRDIYYNENSTDTQMSNCPQDMTLQHQFSQCSEVKHEVSQNQEISAIEDLRDNTLTNAIPERLMGDESHYENYPIENTGVDKFHRDMTRSGEESTLPLGNSHTREIATQDLLLDGKRLSSECVIETKGLVTLVGGVMDGDRNYRGCASEAVDGDRMYKGCGSDVRGIFAQSEASTEGQRNLQEDLSKALPPEEIHSLVPSALDNTPRQVKFKINRSSNSSTSGLLSNNGQDTFSAEASPSGNTSVTNIIDIPHLETDERNPDDPDEVLQEDLIDNQEKQDTKQENGIKLETEDSTIKALNKSEGDGKNENPTAISKDPPRRTSRRVKVTEKGKEIIKTAAATTERVCELCQASFPQTKEYFVHMRGHFPGPPHRCDTCEASFKRIYHLLEHRITHQEAKTHKCPHCPFSSHKKFNLTEHLTQHTRNRKYKCKTCGDLFSRIQILRVHETKHTKERPFLCETCGWSGKTKNALIVHTKIHTGELLRCQFPNCTYATAKKSHLKEHMQHHSNSRPFVCDICGRNFITNSHLRRHMKLHLREKPFKCPQCDYCSPRQDRLKIHVKKKHSQKEPVKAPTRKRQSKKKTMDVVSTSEQSTEVTNVITAHIECSQADIFSDLENTNVSLQPQLPGTPPPTTLSEYPPSPTYTFPAQSAPDDPLMMVSDMSSVTEGFTPLPQASPLHRNLGPSLNYEGSYHSPQYQTSPSHFAALSPTHATLSYANGHHQEESPLNFAAYMKY